MTYHAEPIAIVGLAAIMPDAPDAATFWNNLKTGRYSISGVPADRWDEDTYYDPDPHAPEKTYSRIGGWVREHPWDPIGWKLPIPPKVAEQMDLGQQWAVSAARAALTDAGWPNWTVDPERVAVVLGNAIGGEKHYRTNMRIEMPEVLRELAHSPSFAALPEQVRLAVLDETAKAYRAQSAGITEDTMPGELANVTAGRIANLFNFKGPNFTTDAACASGLAAIWSAAQGLATRQFDVAVTGGIDRNMGVAAFVKFCKIGALSATGTRPFDAGADGFVMGEGAAVYVLKRLADAERAGDRIYGVLLGIAGSSDGKGKGITAPNPAGQRIAVQQAWEQAGVSPATATMVEAHGTSTRVGDAAELESLNSVFGPAGAAPGSIALGSVKSNIGHLKAAAGTAGLFKLAMSLHEKVLVPSLNFKDPNPNVDWNTSPFRVNTELREWPQPAGDVRRGAVSAFGFGGTNFHAVVEEYVPGRHVERPLVAAGVDLPQREVDTPVTRKPADLGRNALVVGGDSTADVVNQLTAAKAEADAGRVPAPFAPRPGLGTAAVRVAIDYADAAELAVKLEKTLKAFAADNAPMFKLLRAQGVYVGGGAAPKVAFLYTGQGSQYVNMLKGLRAAEPIVADAFDEADRVTTPLLGRPLSSYIFVDGDDPAAVKTLEQQLLQTEITQPAVLTADLALTEVLAAHGIKPDMVMGHSLGEYGALVAAGALDYDAAIEAVSARGHEMASLSLEDNGAMAAVFGPLTEIERIVAAADGYVVIANINSNNQAVVGGATVAVEKVIEQFQAAGMTAVRIPVSHAFHTSIVAPASVPLQAALRRLNVRGPKLPIVANVTGEFYPADADSDFMVDVLGRQVASPVQFVKGLDTLYAAGARVFVEVGPKKALYGFVDDVLASVHDDVLPLFTNHPKQGDAASLNQALCGLYAAGLGVEPIATPAPPVPPAPATTQTPVPATTPTPAPPATRLTTSGTPMSTDKYLQLGQLFAEFLDRGRTVYEGAPAAPSNGHTLSSEPVAITGAALGLPGVPRVFDDENVARILAGQQFIDTIPHGIRQEMVDKHITRLVKPESGDPIFVAIDSEADVIKLAGRHAPFDLGAEFGVEDARDAALDTVTRLAIGAGFDALRDAGIPLVQHYRTTTLGTKLPERWGLPTELRDDTGVIFASAFPGYNEFARDLRRYYQDRGRRHELATLQDVRARMGAGDPAVAEVDRRIGDLEHQLETDPFVFDRRFLFRALSMGHAQFAELIGARGPNTQINAACASTTQAFSIAEDWIRTGRARRVIVVSADDVTSDELLPWIGSGFLASGAAATDDVVADAATPFDRRRHGMIVGTGAAAVVLESAAAARERGIQPICEVLGAVVANSAFHGTRLDVDHVGAVMEQLLRQVEARGVRRSDIAAQTVFVSHETYTPARGGSAAAEINALRAAFGPDADKIVIANTKGFTGHAMGAGIEDVVAIKSLETGVVPPVPNYKEADPDLGALNLSRGGAYPVEYALRLAAGFGSQVAMTVLRRTPVAGATRPRPDDLGYRHRIADPATWNAWLARVTGLAAPQLEVVTRRLRVADIGAPAVTPSVAPAPAAPAPVSVPVPAPAAVVAAPVVAAAAPEPVAPVSAEPAGDPLVEAVVGIVAEMTGYPAELLDPDLDLEADLGVDTVKQAEVFAAVREKFNVERDENLKLRDFPTLNHVVGWVLSKKPELAATVATASAAAAPATPATPAAPAVPEPAPAPAAATDPVVDAVVAIVAEMTGYPAELLDPDLDLEADLGVDTVKQAEVFAAVREKFNVERDENLKLRDFPTLNHVVGWVRSKKPELAATVVAAPAPAPAPAAAAPAPTPAPAAAPAASDPVVQAVTDIVAQMTGYPAELLDPDLDLEADLGVDTVKQAEVFAAVREKFNVERDENLQLRDFPTLNHVVGWVRSKKPELAAAVEASAAPAAATPAPSAEPVPAATDPVVTDPVVQAVTDIVAQMTGYPAELLDPDLDLEADLGVDTVKQAEVFAAVREKFNVERDENLQLRDFPTLNHVVGWVRSKLPADVTPVPTAATPEEPAPAQPAERPEPTAFVNSDAYPRRIPVPVVRPPATAFNPTGVALAEGDRVLIMLDAGGVGDRLAHHLEHVGVTPLMLSPGIATAKIAPAVQNWLAEGPIAGVFWLAALDDEGPLSELDQDAWHEALRRRVKNLYTTIRAAYDQQPFLVTATRLGGYHGYDDAGATAPLGGAAVGFTKAYHRERPELLVKAVDVPLNFPAEQLVDVLVEEARYDAAAVEIGRQTDGTRWSIGLAERPFPEDGSGTVLDSGSVFLVTGAAGSIVSAITADLARASGGTFHLLDLTDRPDPADADLQLYRQDADALKKQIAARLKADGKRPTPVLIEKEIAHFERLASAQAAIDSVTAAGGTAHYHQVDLTDADAVRAVLSQVRETSGKIDVLLHAAGLEISKALPDKSAKEYDLVFDVKSDGWFNVLSAAGDLPIGATVAFSSVAGRFGNAGQTDYSAANDLLAKTSSSFRRTRPGTRAIVLDWTAWAGIGMATRGSIPKVMELAGIEMLDPAVGVPWIRRELTTSTRSGEVLVAGRLGVLLADAQAPSTLSVPAVGPMVGTVTASIAEGVRIEVKLDPKAEPFLDDHRIDGTAVLPGVMGIESFVEAAAVLVPGWSVTAVEDVDFLAPVKFYRNKARSLTVYASGRRVGSDVIVSCRLEAARTVRGSSAPVVTTHFVGSVRLQPEPPTAERGEPIAEPGTTVAPERVYELYFHGPAYQVVGAAWQGGWQDGPASFARLAEPLPPNHTAPVPVLAQPRLVELCFQTAGLWEAVEHGRMALPQHVDRVRLIHEPQDGTVYAQAVQHGEEFDCAVRDASGELLLTVEGYRTVALPDPVPEPIRQGLSAATELT